MLARHVSRGRPVEISFKTAKLAKVCNSRALLLRTYGRDNGHRIALRLTVLAAAESLRDVAGTPPERCHALKGDLAGCFAVDVLQPYRIVFTPTDPALAARGPRLSRAKVTAITLLAIVDYHG